MTAKPGYALVGAKENKVFFSEYQGFANLKAKEEIGPNTQFRLASLTKPFTMMAILYLVNQGKINLVDPLSLFFPNFPRWAKDVKVSNLLSHTSGLPDYEEVLKKQNITKGNEPNNKSALEVISKFDSSLFRPGSKQLYSETGYVLLALLIEQVAQIPYKGFLEKIIFRPLKMTNTLVADKPTQRFKRRAIGYQRVNRNYSKFDYDPLNYIVGNEGIYSTANDLIKWSNALFSDRIVPQKLLKKAFTPAKLYCCIPAARGYSFEVNKFRNEKIVYHSGSWVGFRLMMLLVPRHKIAIFFLANSTEYDDKTQRIIPILDLLCQYW